MKKYLNFLLGLVAVIFLAACDHVSDTIDEAFEAYQQGKLSQAHKLVTDLMDEGVSDLSVYDKANIGLAALFFGVECNDLKLGKKGYDLAVQAWRADPQECKDMLKYEKYFDDQSSNYPQTVKALYSQLEDLELAQDAIATWQTNYSQNRFGESQTITETLTLNRDKTFTEHNLISIKDSDGTYNYQCKAETTVDGKWEIEDQTLILRYKPSTLEVSLVPGEFKTKLTNSAFWSGAAFSLAFAAVESESELKEYTKTKLYDSLNEAYHSDTAWNISFEDNEMILQSYDETHTYTQL